MQNHVEAAFSFLRHLGEAVALLMLGKTQTSLRWGQDFTLDNFSTGELERISEN